MEFVASALQLIRPFLSPLKSFSFTRPRGGVRSVPTYVSFILHFLVGSAEKEEHTVSAAEMSRCHPGWTVIKKGRGHKEYDLANQLKKKCEKKKLQGIHDRFLRDQEFRVRMIEHHRDEEVCRRWDVLADEDHTYHLSEQEYFYYKNKWWLHSNKSGSNTLPLRNRSDFKQALSTLERLQQEAGDEPYVPTYSYKHKQWQLAQSSSSTWRNWQDSWWSS